MTTFKILFAVILIFSHFPAIILSSERKQDISPETFAKLLQIVAAKQHVFDNRNILETSDSGGTQWKPLTPFRTNPWQQPRFFIPKRPERTSMKRSKFPRHIEMNRRPRPIPNDLEIRNEQLRKKYNMLNYEKQRNGHNISRDLLYKLRLLVLATLKDKNETFKNHHHNNNKNMTLVTIDNNNKTILFSNQSESKHPTPKSKDIDTSVKKSGTHSFSHISVSSTTPQETLTSQSLSTKLGFSVINHQVLPPLSSVNRTATIKAKPSEPHSSTPSHTTSSYWNVSYKNIPTKPSIKSETVEECSNQTDATSESVVPDSWSQWNSHNDSNTSMYSEEIFKLESEVEKERETYRIAGEIKRDTENKRTTHIVTGLGPRSEYISNKKLSTISDHTDLKDWTIEDVVESKNMTRKNKKPKKVRKIEEIRTYTDSNISSTNETYKEENFNGTLNETQGSENGHPKSRHGGTIYKDTLHDDVLTEAYMEYFATSYISVIVICVAFILLGNIVVYKFYRRHRILEDDVEWRRHGSLSDQSELY